MTTALLSTTYFGPVQWYQKLYRYDSVLIEQYETFPKQTFRNRCLIATTNGIQALTVPVCHAGELSSFNFQLSTKESAITATGAICIGRLCSRLMASHHSLSTMRTTCVLSSRSTTGNASLTITMPSVGKCASYSISTPPSTIPQNTRPTTPPISGRSSIPSILAMTPTSYPVPIIRSTSRNTASCPTSASWTSCLTWVRKVSSIYETLACYPVSVMRNDGLCTATADMGTSLARHLQP